MEEPMRLIDTAREVDAPVKGLEVAAAGKAILAEAGIDNPTEEQLAAAYRIAAAQTQEPVEQDVPARVATNSVLAKRANALLATRRIFQPTEAEFLAAVTEVAIELGIPAGGIR
jgi:hypothetical protein